MNRGNLLLLLPLSCFFLLISTACASAGGVVPASTPNGDVPVQYLVQPTPVGSYKVASGLVAQARQLLDSSPGGVYEGSLSYFGVVDEEVVFDTTYGIEGYFLENEYERYILVAPLTPEHDVELRSVYWNGRFLAYDPDGRVWLEESLDLNFPMTEGVAHRVGASMESSSHEPILLGEVELDGRLYHHIRHRQVRNDIPFLVDSTLRTPYSEFWAEYWIDVESGKLRQVWLTCHQDIHHRWAVGRDRWVGGSLTLTFKETTSEMPRFLPRVGMGPEVDPSWDFSRLFSEFVQVDVQQEP